MKKMNMIASGVWGFAACAHTYCFSTCENQVFSAFSFVFATASLSLCIFYAYMAGQES